MEKSNFSGRGRVLVRGVSNRKFSITFKLDLSSVFPATSTENITKQFNGNTCFDISAGAISESFCLGEGGDVKYTEGKPSVTVTRRGTEGGGCGKNCIDGKPNGTAIRRIGGRCIRREAGYLPENSRQVDGTKYADHEDERQTRLYRVDPGRPVRWHD